MIIIYTGEGKGKTSACVGQAVRAHGQGVRVAFGQFMKRDGQAGEQKILKEILGDNFIASGHGFFRNKEDFPAHRRAALALLAWVKQLFPKVDMVILDEALYALSHNLLERDELLFLIEKAENSDVHLVLSGRGLPEWLEEKADIVTVMEKLKHHLNKGVSAQIGIEF